jgi:acetyl esterase
MSNTLDQLVTVGGSGSLSTLGYLLTFGSLAISVLLLLVLLGVVVPGIRYLGEIGTVLESFFSLYLILAAGICGLCSYAGFRITGESIALLGVALALINVIGFCIPLVSFIRSSAVYQTTISWGRHLAGGFSVGRANAARAVQFATTPDGKALSMEISTPRDYRDKQTLTPVVLIHGGGFIAGTRNEEPAWNRFYTGRGYVVFDVDYRLATATYHTWDKAAADIAAAILWIGNHAVDYSVDMSKLLLVGGSAGGALALQVAYGIAEGTLQTYEPGLLPLPKAVVAIFPAPDITAIWDSTTRFLGLVSHSVCDKYVGGSPQDFPQAYATVDVARHVSSHSPPTLVIAGQHDHVIPYQSQVQFVDVLAKNGVPHEFISLPFTDHFSLFRPAGLSGQIAFQAVGRFLDTYAK